MDFYIIILNKYKFIFYKIKLIFNYKNLYFKFEIKILIKNYQNLILISKN